MTTVFKDAKKNHYFVWFRPAHSVDQNIEDSEIEEDSFVILNIFDLWLTYPNLILCPQLRIAMNRKDRKRILKALELKDPGRSEWISASSGRADDSADSEDLLKEEITSYREWKFNVNKNTSGKKMSDLVKKHKNVEIAAKAPKAPKTIDFQRKLDLLAPDKFLNVSKLKENGAGAVTHDYPTKKTKLFWSNEEPLLRLMSNNYKSYVMAVNMLDHPEQYENHLNDIFEQSGGGSALSRRENSGGLSIGGRKVGTLQYNEDRDEESDSGDQEQENSENEELDQELEQENDQDLDQELDQDQDLNQDLDQDQDLDQELDQELEKESPVFDGRRKLKFQEEKNVVHEFDKYVTPLKERENDFPSSKKTKKQLRDEELEEFGEVISEDLKNLSLSDDLKVDASDDDDEVDEI
jgi:hypothetical protein